MLAVHQARSEIEGGSPSFVLRLYFSFVLFVMWLQTHCVTTISYSLLYFPFHNFLFLLIESSKGGRKIRLHKNTVISLLGEVKSV